mmetsp:Transcript_99789/g.282389  ORF Transcript_99789/g.282389 Transcript_99789/m.282389 type:complete len:213 (-) Transcript_99789:1038-1676(-)
MKAFSSVFSRVPRICSSLPWKSSLENPRIRSLWRATACASVSVGLEGGSVAAAAATGRRTGGTACSGGPATCLVVGLTSSTPRRRSVRRSPKISPSLKDWNAVPSPMRWTKRPRVNTSGMPNCSAMASLTSRIVAPALTRTCAPSSAFRPTACLTFTQTFFGALFRLTVGRGGWECGTPSSASISRRFRWMSGSLLSSGVFRSTAIILMTPL